MAAPLQRLTTPYGVEQTTPFWLENLERCKQKFSAVKNAVGSVETYERLPELRIDSVSALSPDDLSESVMRGTDQEGREFVAFRMQDRASRTNFAVCFCQRAKYADDWYQPCTLDRKVFQELSFDKNINVMSEIVLGTHPEFCLV